MKSKQLATALRKAISVVCDADNWITLKSGSKVELNEQGEVQKGMGGKHTGQNIKEAAKEMSQESKGSKEQAGSKPALELKPERTSWGKASSTPSGLKKNELPMRDKNALSNASKFNSKETAERVAMSQTYVTNVLQGESGQFWVPATNREESILKRLGYKEAK